MRVGSIDDCRDESLGAFGLGLRQWHVLGDEVAEVFKLGDLGARRVGRRGGRRGGRAPDPQLVMMRRGIIIRSRFGMNGGCLFRGRRRGRDRRDRYVAFIPATGIVVRYYYGDGKRVRLTA